MPHYRLYRLTAADKIVGVIDVEAQDDDAATAEAIRIDHAYVIEIWCGNRLVTRVDPGQLSTDAK